MKKVNLTPREIRRKQKEGSEKLRLWLVSWVYNSHGQPQHIVDGMKKTQIAKWKDHCYQANRHGMILDPLAFEEMAKDSKVIKGIERSLGFRKITKLQKIIFNFKQLFKKSEPRKQAA